MTALELAPSIIIPMVREVPVESLKRRPQPGRWSVHEHACHFAQVQPMFFERLDLMLSENDPYIKPYFPDADHEDDALLNSDLDESLDLFARQRQELVGRLRELFPDQWQRSARHGEYTRYSVFILFRHAVMHDMLHAYRIEELLLKKDWPPENA
jgi:uncharacterized damage-inducible protein DinB